jgi:hypothetical protein
MIPATFPQHGHILGQPFTLSGLSLPVNVTVTCNCAQPPSEIVILASAPARCPACQKTYLVAFNPQTGQVTVGIQAADQQVPS